MITKNSLTDLENITKLRFCQIIKNKIMSPDYLNMCHVTCHSSFTFSPVPTSNIVSDWTQIGLITIFVPLILHIFLLLLGHDSICSFPCWNLTLRRPKQRRTQAPDVRDLAQTVKPWSDLYNIFTNVFAAAKKPK